MKHASVQIHLDKTDKSIVVITNIFSCLNPYNVVADKEITYVTLVFETLDLFNWWQQIDKLLIDNSLKESAIVVAEGENSWNDHLLLHSFDPTENIETIDENGKVRNP